MAIEIAAITEVGQINVGDVLLIKPKRSGLLARVYPVTVKQVIRQNTEDEEVIFSIRQNKFFNTQMMIDGTSWVKECSKLCDWVIFSISNTTKKIEF